MIMTNTMTLAQLKKMSSWDLDGMLPLLQVTNTLVILL